MADVMETLPDQLPTGAEKARVVEQMFDRIAPRYDLLNRLLTFRMDVAWRRAAVNSLQLVAGARVLDLACGTGDLCRTLESAGYVAIGTDFSAGMLAAARTNAPLVRADAVHLPFADASLDGLTCGFALRNFVDLGTVFAECARVLRSDGRFAAVDATVPANPVMRAGNAVWLRLTPIRRTSPAARISSTSASRNGEPTWTAGPYGHDARCVGRSADAEPRRRPPPQPRGPGGLLARGVGGDRLGDATGADPRR